MNKQPVSYLQTDPKWAVLDYSAPGEKTTIGASGCGPTAMAMVLATWADKSVTPKTECAWALAHGYKAPRQGTYYGYFVPAAARYGLKARQLSWTNIYGNSKSPLHEEARRAVEAGHLVIACMGKGLWTSSGHYVLVWKIQGNIVYINDPASTRSVRTQGDYNLFKQQVKYYWVIEGPENMKEEPDMTEKEVRKLLEEYLPQTEPAKYDTIEEVPEWGQATVRKLMSTPRGDNPEKMILEGEGDGLGLTYDLLRVLVINDRAGLYD